MKVIAIDSKWFYAGVVLDDGAHVCRCAPIVNYMKGWSERRVLRFAADRKWTAHAIETDYPSLSSETSTLWKVFLDPILLAC